MRALAMEGLDIAALVRAGGLRWLLSLRIWMITTITTENNVGGPQVPALIFWWGNRGLFMKP
jgi:hypothetical protein